MASLPVIGVSDNPDLHHPLKFRQAEAKWKRGVSLAHAAFCSCGNFLLHFKWCGGERRDTGDPDGADGGVDAATNTGEDITGHTGGDGDVTDLELLQ
uniref:ORF2 n=1 Tax=Torque teno Leptonychotes weddellii virus-1 TaxID=2012676 RepID=A0A1Z2RV99_9VIRU|nr:ORF2 [Torque teno Leptonychotes weddellii virus 1]ASA48521.1 ORF2 [Torque teno Leptonychotes weddellii virus 1]